MSKRNRTCMELTQTCIAPSPEAARSSSSSSELLGFFPPSSSSSVSYSSKMPNVSPEAEDQVQSVTETKPMDLAGCPRCFMYVLLSEDDPKCPKYNTKVFLEIFKDENFKTDN